MGYCPSESRYNGLYRDTEVGKAGLDAKGWATTRPATPTIRPGRACNTAERKARHDQQRARVRPGWGTMSQYNILYHDRRQLGCRVVSRDRLVTRRRSCDTARSDTRWGAAIQCTTQPARLATRPGSATTRKGTPVTRPGDGYNMAPVRATTRTSARHVRGLSVVGVQPGLRVCTWCTQPSFRLSALFLSHYLGHCS